MHLCPNCSCVTPPNERLMYGRCENCWVLNFVTQGRKGGSVFSYLEGMLTVREALELAEVHTAALSRRRNGKFVEAVELECTEPDDEDDDG